jgi:hypothetical protein
MRKTSRNAILLIILALILAIFNIGSVHNPNLQSPKSSYDRPGWEWSELDSTSCISFDSEDDSLSSDTANYNGYLYTVWSDANGLPHKDIYLSTYSLSSWSSPFLVTTAGTDNAITPAVAVHPDGVHFVWVDYSDDDGEGDADIYYRNYTSSEGLSPIQDVSTTSNLTSFYPDIIVDEEGNVHIVWLDFYDEDNESDWDIYYANLSTGDSSFSNPIDLTPESSEDCGRPKLEMHPNGNLLVAYVDTLGTDEGVYYKNLNLTTSIWSNRILITPESDSNIDTFDFYFDSLDNFHLVWLQGSTDLYYKKHFSSDDQWSNAEFFKYFNAVDVALAVDDWDNIYVMYRSSFASYIMQWESIGGFWSEPEILGGGFDLFIDSLYVLEDGTVYAIHNSEYDWDGTGSDDTSDQDIFLRKYSGSQVQTPILAPINPNDGESGTIHLEWTKTVPATKYFIYRSNSTIWNIRDLSPIANTSLNEHTDTISNEGVYYYIVVAQSEIGLNSSISNNVNVLVDFPEESPVQVSEVGWRELLYVTAGIVALQLILFSFSLAKNRKRKKKAK